MIVIARQIPSGDLRGERPTRHIQAAPHAGGGCRQSEFFPAVTSPGAVFRPLVKLRQKTPSGFAKSLKISVGRLLFHEQQRDRGFLKCPTKDLKGLTK